jgi:hypothetical protein
MAVIDLLNLLPIIVAALIGAYANGLYRDHQDKQAREREGEGLLRIIDAELYENNRLLRNIKESADIAKYPSQSHLSTDAWDQSRARLGQFLSRDAGHIFTLNRHYTLVTRIRATLQDPAELQKSLDSASRKRRRTKEYKDLQEQVGRAEVAGESKLSSLANQALSAGEEARQKGGEYTGALPRYDQEDVLAPGSRQQEGPESA